MQDTLPTFILMSYLLAASLILKTTVTSLPLNTVHGIDNSANSLKLQEPKEEPGGIKKEGVLTLDVKTDSPDSPIKQQHIRDKAESVLQPKPDEEAHEESAPKSPSIFLKPNPPLDNKSLVGDRKISDKTNILPSNEPEQMTKEKEHKRELARPSVEIDSTNDKSASKVKGSAPVEAQNPADSSPFQANNAIDKPLDEVKKLAQPIDQLKPPIPPPKQNAAIEENGFLESLPKGQEKPENEQKIQLKENKEVENLTEKLLNEKNIPVKQLTGNQFAKPLKDVFSFPKLETARKDVIRPLEIEHIESTVSSGLTMEYVLIACSIIMIVLLLTWRRFWYTICGAIGKMPSANSETSTSYYRVGYKPMNA